MNVETVRLPSAHVDADALAREVQYYLSLAPRQLPSRFLYDALGSALFDAICHLPWYPVTRAERRLIEDHRREILEAAGQPRTVIELGSGNGEKIALLLREGAVSRTVHLIDVSATALEGAESRVLEIPGLSVVKHQDQYEEGIRGVAQVRQPGERALLLFFGSNLGNFDPPDAIAFLTAARQSLRDGDVFALGVDLVKPEHTLLTAYDDPLGVTAAFNKNLLVRLNQELDADFDLSAFVHRAVWNAEASRIEMHLESTIRQTVTVPKADLSFTLEPGERIWTESSYKYDPADVDRMLRQAGFTPQQAWTHDESRFLLQLCRV